MRASGKRIADFALKGRLPSLYGDKGGVEAGGLLYYGADLADIYRPSPISWTKSSRAALSLLIYL